MVPANVKYLRYSTNNNYTHIKNRRIIRISYCWQTESSSKRSLDNQNDRYVKIIY